MLRSPTYTPEFKAQVIKDLLFDVAVTSEFSSRYGVPPVQVRRWIRQTITRLHEVFGDGTSSNISNVKQMRDDQLRLSSTELHTLLADLDGSIPED